MGRIFVDDAPERVRVEWGDLDHRDLTLSTGPYFRALEGLAGAARRAVEHLAHNAKRSNVEPDYATACLLLMRPDSPGGQLLEALNRLDAASAGVAVPDREE